MSYSDLEQWNPMEDEYRRNFSRPGKPNVTGDIDLQCLYVKNIPIELSKDDFMSLMSADGRRVSSVNLTTKQHSKSRTKVGFANFATHEDALHAREELNEKPPLFLSISFAKKKKDKQPNANQENLQQMMTSSGRGIHQDQPSGGLLVQPYNNHEDMQRLRMQVRGRGARLDLDGQRSISISQIKITAGAGSGRRVVMDAPPRESNSVADGQFSGVKFPHQNLLENCKSVESTVAPHHKPEGNRVLITSPPRMPRNVEFHHKSSDSAASQKHDATTTLVQNPFSICFHCEKEARFSCKYCMKPYCSKSCQTADLQNHQQRCKQMQKAAEALLQMYRNSESDSSYMSECSGSDQENTSLKASSTVKTENKLEKFAISAGEVEVVSVVHAENPSKFWVRLKKYEQDFLKFERELSSKNLVSYQLTSYIAPNLICCTTYNGKICRAEVLKATTEKNVLVYLLDYGKTFAVLKSALYSLPASLRSIPIQAIPCKLVDETMKEDVDWNEGDSLSFQLHTCDNKLYKAIFRRCLNDVHEVSLINEDGMTLYTILKEEKEDASSCMSSGPGKSTKDTQHSPNISRQQVSPMHPMEHSNTVEKAVAPAHPTGHSKAVEKAVAPALPTGHPKAVEKAMAPRVLSPNKTYTIRVLFIKTASELFVQLTEDETEMNKMLGSLNTFCNSRNASYVPSVGEIACCKFSEDQLWYRGLVKEKLKDKYRVFFVDYGNEDIVLENDIQVLPEKFVSPSYAICVSLSGIKNEDIKSLVPKLFEGKWEMKVVDDKKSPVEVMLYLNDCPLSEMTGKKTNKVSKPDQLQKDSSCSESNVGSKSHNANALKFKKLPTEVTTDVKISYEDEEYVYLYQVKDSEVVEDLLQQLNSLSDLPAVKNPAINNVYRGLCSDGVWYRVIVKEKASNMFKVFFVDFGNYENVSANNLTELPDNLFSVPVCCIPAIVENREEVKLNMEEQFTVKVTGIQGDKQRIKFINQQEDSSKCSIAQTKPRKVSSLKYEKLPRDGTVDIKVSYEDDSYLYLHRVKDLEVITDLLVKLPSLSKMPSVRNPLIDNVYCGLCSDGAWYRVIVKEKVSNLFKVFFVDFGNYEDVSADNLRDLPDELFAVPVCCIPTIVENREELTLNMEEQYTVKVTGALGHVQKIKFVSQQKDISENHVAESKHDADSLKYEKLPSGITLDVKVSYEDEKYIYVQQVKDVKAVEELLVKLNTLSELPEVNNPVINKVYCGLFTDGIWYRVIVKEKISNQFKVYFLDFGNYENISPDNLKELPDDLFAVPVCCIPVVVENRKELTITIEEQYSVKVIGIQGGVQKVKFINQQEDSSENHVAESKHDADSLKYEKLASGVTLDVKVSYEDEKYIYVQQVKDEKIIADILVKLNALSELPDVKNPIINKVYCGLFTDGIWYRVIVKEKISNQFKVYFLDFGNYENISPDNLKELPDDLFAVPVCCIPVVVENRKELTITIEEQYSVKVTGIQGGVQKVKFVNQQEDSSETAVIKTKPRAASSLKYEKLPDGVAVDIKLSFEDEKYVYLHQVKDLEVVADLLVKLPSLSEMPSVTNPVINNVYCGLCSDGAWYRVIVKEKVSDLFKVFFVDFGNYENVSADNLRELPDELFAVPVCCVPTIVENRGELTLSMEEQYAVKVTGAQENVQKIQFLNQQKDISENRVAESKHNADSLKHEKLPSGITLDVKVSYKDEKYVYVHQVKDVKAVEELLVKLNTLSELPVVKNPVINNVYCGLFIDGFWYRVIVKEKVSDLFKVYFCDYGNYENVSSDSLRELPEEILTVPVFCVPTVVENRKELTIDLEQEYSVRVTGTEGEHQKVKIVLPTEDEVKLPHISSFKKQSLQEGVNEVQICSLEGDVIYSQLTSDSERVLDLFKKLQKCGQEGSTASSLSVGDVICAQSSDNCWYRASVVSDRKAPSYKVFFFDYGSSEIVTGDCVKILPAELLDFPVFAIPMKINNIDKLKDNSIYTESFSVKKIKVLDKNVHVVDVIVEEAVSLPKISSLKEEILPSGSLSKVTICFIDDGTFFVQPASLQDKVYSLEKELLQAETFVELSCTPQVNDVVCAKCSSGDWYRGAVEEVDAEKAKILFIDYGNSETVALQDLKTLPPELCSYPILCMPVKFSDVKTLEAKLLADILTFDVKVCGLDDGIQLVDISSEADAKKPDSAVHASHTPVFFSAINRKELPLNEERNVVFYCKEGEKFFLQDSADIENITELQQTIFSECCSPSPKPYKPVVGELVCAKSQLDNSWYRGCVEEVLGPNEYKIFFIDYGNCESVHSQDLQQISASLVKFPSFSIAVKFNSEKVSRTIQLEKPYTIKAETKAVNHLQIVKLTSAENGQNDQEINILESATKRNKIIKGPPKFTFTSCKCVPFNSGEQDIVIYNVDEEGYIFCAPYIAENIAANIELSRLLTEYCTSNGIPFEDGCEPELDEMVLALYPEDNQWYRAAVIEKAHPMYAVNFVDYGNTEQLDISYLRKMEEKFMELSVQAHMCSLTGFTVSEENLPKVYEELKNFTVFVSQEPLSARVQVNDGDITANVPKIISCLVKKNLVTSSHPN